MDERSYCSALDNSYAFSPSDLKAYEGGVVCGLPRVSSFSKGEQLRKYCKRDEWLSDVTHWNLPLEVTCKLTPKDYYK